MLNLLNLYRKYLNKYPFIFQSVQTAILMSAGDIACQKLIEKKSWTEYNGIRTGRFFVIGLFFVGPVTTSWFVVLDNYIGPQKFAPIKKVIMDQIVMAPTINGGVLTSLELLQRHSLADAKAKVQKELPDILKKNYQVWPFAQMFNFFVMPLNYQTLFVQIVGCFWNTYLSWRLNNPSKV